MTIDSLDRSMCGPHSFGDLKETITIKIFVGRVDDLLHFRQGGRKKKMFVVQFYVRTASAVGVVNPSSKGVQF